MIKVKIKPKDKRSFIVPLPYFLLHTGGWIISSRFLWNLINSGIIKKRLADNTTVSWIPASIDRKDTQLLIRTVKTYRGLTLVEVVSEDGTEVIVRL